MILNPLKATKPFQKEFWADKTANKEGVTRQEILDKWDYGILSF